MEPSFLVLTFAVVSVLILLCFFHRDNVYQIVKGWGIWPWIQVRHPKLAKRVQPHRPQQYERCPLNNAPVARRFDRSGGRWTIDDHGITVTVPHGAIADGCEVEIQVAVSISCRTFYYSTRS